MDWIERQIKVAQQLTNAVNAAYAPYRADMERMQQVPKAAQIAYLPSVYAAEQAVITAQATYLRFQPEIDRMFDLARAAQYALDPIRGDIERMNEIVDAATAALAPYQSLIEQLEKDGMLVQPVVPEPVEENPEPEEVTRAELLEVIVVLSNRVRELEDRIKVQSAFDAARKPSDN